MNGKKPYSMLSNFYKDDDVPYDENTGEIYTPGSKKYLNHKKHKEQIIRDKKIGEKNKLIDHLDTIIDTIKNIELNKNGQDDDEQVKQLKILKEKALKNISILFDDILNYIESIKKFETETNISPGRDDYNTEKRKKLDEDRTRKHNILIDRIKNSMSFISHAFGKINENEIDYWEEKNNIVANINRVDLPEKLFLPQGINLRDRKDIAAWAMQIYDEVKGLKTKIKNELSQNEKAQNDN